tara:strand:- start:1206 stop:2060 length:855 start_codon:yes stop_codon:yes gene_type:complete
MQDAVMKWLAVNGGVMLCALTVAGTDHAVHLLTSSALLSALAATAVLYTSVYAACAHNLRGRPRSHGNEKPLRPVAIGSVLAHPLGSAVERYLWTHWYGARAAASSTWVGSSIAIWYPLLLCRLLLFELAFDMLFYIAHRAVHLPAVYRRVHKLHHAHTHDLRLLSALQMSPLDALLTHTVPLLGALLLVPLAPGFELSIAKCYLLFQELYGHAGVENRGRNFGPAPWLATWLGVELRSEDHQHHHIRGEVNFSKRFSLFDRLGGTWEAPGVAPPSRTAVAASA